MTDEHEALASIRDLTQLAEDVKNKLERIEADILQNGSDHLNCEDLWSAHNASISLKIRLDRLQLKLNDD